jgi:hypothetical protein
MTSYSFERLKMKIIYILASLIILMPAAFSQVNIESFRNSATKSGFFGEAKGNISFQHGNVNSQNYEIANALHFKSNIHHILLQSSLSKGYQDKTQYRNSAFIHLRYTIMLHDLIGYEIFTQTQYAEFKDLELRQLNGAGARFEKTFTNDKPFQIAIGTGIMSDHEELLYETTTQARSTSYLSISKSFTTDNSSFITAVTYYQPLIFNHSDYRINTEVNLRASIINKKEYSLGLNISLTYLYDTVPAVKIENTDVIFKTGLAASW